MAEEGRIEEDSPLAISPPSDIVLDVARAAAPADVVMARARLDGHAAATAPAFEPGTAAPRRADASVGTDAGSQFKRFEAMVLQTFIQNMLPKDTEAVYGKGLAGEMWKSQLAERLADVMADRGGIGIARSMLADHYMDGKRKVPVGPVSGGPQKTEIDAQARLSASLVQELQRRVVAAMSGEPATEETASKV